MVTSFYPPFHVGGGCTHVYYLANALAERGHEVHVLFSEDAYRLIRKPGVKKDYPNHQNVVLHNIRTTLGRYGPLHSYVFGGMPLSSGARKVFAQDFDVIHYHNISLLGPQIFFWGDAPKLYTAHDHWLTCGMNDFFESGRICSKSVSPETCAVCMLKNHRPVQIWRFTDVLRRGLSHIHTIIAPSDYIKQFYMRQGIKNTIVVLPNFIHGPKSIAKHDAPLHPFFLFVGMLQRGKGVWSLIRAFCKMPDQRLYMAGTGVLENEIKSYLRKNRIANIHLLGFLNQSDLFAWYSMAEALVLSSECPDNCPNTILEAYSMGIPAIGPAIGGIPDLIRQVDSNLIFKYKDMGDLQRVIRSFDKRKYSAHELQALWVRRFSADSYLPAYLDIIESVRTPREHAAVQVSHVVSS